MGFGLLDVGRAKELLEQALQLDPRFGRARAEYGFLHLVMITTGRSNNRDLLYKAEEQILQGLREDPTFSYGHAALAGLYIHDGHKERALSEIAATQKIDPYNAAARHWVAVSMNLSGDSTAARKLFTETLARHPRFFPSQMYLGELARQQGDWEDSIPNGQNTRTA
jgi:tetratricopeptide (TPR) repeat protein